MAVHMHLHTDGSTLDGMCNIDRAIQKAIEQGESALGISDHGSMIKVFEFYSKCTANNINPVIGCEFYMGEQDTKDRFHILLIAKNNTGLKNLYKLMHKSYKNISSKPRITKEALIEHRKGLVCLTACIGNEIFKKFIQNKNDAEQFIIETLVPLFGDDLYLEIQPNSVPMQDKYNMFLIDVCNKYNLKPIVTCDCHYINKEDFVSHDTMLCIQTTKKKNTEGRFRFSTNDFYMKSDDEIREGLSYIDSIYVEQAIQNTRELANMCSISIGTNDVLVPEMPEIKDEIAHFKKLIQDGYTKRYNDGWYKGLDVKEVKKRINYELKILIEKKYVGYFLIVDDYLRWCRANNIYTGIGRGSCCGSEIAFVLEMTEVEPIRYNLLFERFINPTRNSFPDFDGDFDYDERYKVIDYIKNKYGTDNVSQIIAEGKMTTKAVVRKVLTAYDYQATVINKICKLIPNEAKNLNDALNKSKELAGKLNGTQMLKDMLNLEGLMSHSSTHAAGLIIAPDRIDNYVPVSIDSETGMQVSQWSKKHVEKCGLIKFDMLGLKQLTIFRKTLEFIEKNKGIHLTRDDLNKINENDKGIYEVLNSGMLMGIFQFTGDSAGHVIDMANPSCFEDIMVCESICRPGVKEAELYLNNKKLFRENGAYPIPEYWDLVKDILEPTYGAIVYQEQTMLIMNKIAGWDLGKADSMRKVKDLEEYREDFLCGAKANGISENIANQIFDRFSLEYSFNKSHACAYGKNSAQTCYLKHYYPNEFMASSMTIELTQAEPNILGFLQECRKMNINIFPPTINNIENEFVPTNDGIFMPLSTIARCGQSVMEEIKKHAPYTSFDDFLGRVKKQKVNSATVTNLIKAGAFDCFNANRSELLEYFYKLTKKDKKVLFYSSDVQMLYEKEVFGFYLSKHPLDGQVNNDFSEYKDGTKMSIVGIVTNAREHIDKKGNKMAFLTLENKKCVFGLTCFSWQYKKFESILKEGYALRVFGKKDGKSILVDNVEVI